MTREHKLSLILGFAVVLVVGVLLSDHLSGARRATLDQADPAGQLAFEEPTPRPSKAPSLVLVDPQGRPLEMTHTDLDPVANPVTDQLAAGEPTRASSAQEELLRTNMFRPVDQPTAHSAPNSGIGEQIADAVKGLMNGQTPVPAAQLDQAPATLKMSAQRPENRPPSSANNGRFRSYTIQPGDTLWAIAQSELGDGFRHTELADLNKDRIGPAGELRVGASIRIPDPAPSEPPASIPATIAKTKAPARNTPAKTAPAPKPMTTYTVKPGDTLGEIAYKQLGSSKRLREILDANRDQLDDADSVRSGMLLKVPAR